MIGKVLLSPENVDGVAAALNELLHGKQLQIESGPRVTTGRLSRGLADSEIGVYRGDDLNDVAIWIRTESGSQGFSASFGDAVLDFAPNRVTIDHFAPDGHELRHCYTVLGDL